MPKKIIEVIAIVIAVIATQPNTLGFLRMFTKPKQGEQTIDL